MMEIVNDISNLQSKWEELINNECLTKKTMCDLCIPFRDKYKLKDNQVLQIARNEVSLETIKIWLEKSDKE